jgi:hypothetical protein
MQTYTKINTLYKRYAFNNADCPNQKWLKFKNKIILGDFSNVEAQYLFDCPWEAYSKIDGTNSKIAFFPSTGEIKVGGKTDNANSQHGQFEMLQEIADRIKPQLCAMFPKESARFAPIKDGNKIQYYLESSYKTEDGGLGIEYHKTDDIQYDPTIPCFRGVELEEVPIYIYGEYFGCGIQKGGGRYIQNGNDFLVFDICQQGWWLPKENRDAMCKTLGLKTVPYLGNMTLRQIEEMVMNGFATKFENASDPTLIEEGIVARPVVPLFDGRGNRIIVKVKYCDYIDYKNVRDEFTDDDFDEFNKWYETVKIL